MGRPKIKNPRSKHVDVRLTVAEHKALAKAANGRPIAELVRTLALAGIGYTQPALAGKTESKRA